MVKTITIPDGVFIDGRKRRFKCGDVVDESLFTSEQIKAIEAAIVSPVKKESITFPQNKTEEK